ncbi:MAG: recombination-associated protein RdgC [Hydrogenophilales bacterium CG17_big_fil_post_rev_8_21_14_2_50_63_12]|nr:MAG: recombination-associated protein RdgC [Hydrogenophilales bacterium CG17_big_fil_post_rev_8_21_14_2_50_63_12]PIX98024.1 MAG: recombination-associated protein RdgC [Hydrogenophilales bacterium CG_4_10_14_3_um_filter_63_21]PJB02688.1 MAG: recombination-associated protein RdgC [Hydrogenophilales bacterium CG_4_9_14_3_um_filter_63_34]
MWFKNLAVYRLPTGLKLDTAALQEKLATLTMQPCGNLDRETRGWVSPRGDDRLLHELNQQVLIALGGEQKLLPASVVNQFTADKAAQIEAQQGFKLGRKQMRELKEQVTDELLPRAFVRRHQTWAWIDPVNGWLVVDAATPAKAEGLLEALSKSVDGLAVQSLHTERSPSAAMTDWLLSGEAPAGFSIDHDLELRASDEGKATVRYVRHTLEGEEIAAQISAHLAAGKQATRLGMTWNDRISFVLGEQMEIKRLAFLDLLKEQTEQGESADEQFDLDFALMSGELAKLLADLVAALGGEKAAAI